jgi:hypothetical protein
MQPRGNIFGRALKDVADRGIELHMPLTMSGRLATSPEIAETYLSRQLQASRALSGPCAERRCVLTVEGVFPRFHHSASLNMRITERLEPDIAVEHFCGFCLQADGAASKTDPVAALVIPLL